MQQNISTSSLLSVRFRKGKGYLELSLKGELHTLASVTMQTMILNINT